MDSSLGTKSQEFFHNTEKIAEEFNMRHGSWLGGMLPGGVHGQRLPANLLPRVSFSHECKEARWEPESHGSRHGPAEAACRPRARLASSCRDNETELDGWRRRPGQRGFRTSWGRRQIGMRFEISATRPLRGPPQDGSWHLLHNERFYLFIY